MSKLKPFSHHTQKILLALSKKARLEPEKYLLINFLLEEYKKVFKKDYLLD
tara:strand:+ start:1642 stop:1794 length:153 start_codon:yes stop_codon:yes gene_type:complete